MQNYRYTVVNSSGKTIRGKMSAQNSLDLEERLAGQNFTVIEYKALKQGSSLGGKVSTKELIMFCVHLEQLDKAGVPLLDALADIRDSADSPTFKNVITEIFESVRGGEILSDAMRKQSRVFDNVFCGLVAAGERTGKMSEAFGHLAHHLKWNDDLKRKIKKAMTYPVVLIVIMSAVVAMMMLFVVPQLKDFLLSQGMELPFYTYWLINTSNFFANFWYLIFGVPILLFIACLVTYRRSDSFHYLIDKIVLKTPVIGQVAGKINLARFSHFFAITFSSGIGVLDCLDTARDVVDNYVMKEAISQVSKNVTEGNTLTRAIASTQYFPNLVVRMFKVGEDSGNMEDALENVNFFYDREVEDSVNAMIGFIQPALTVVMGVIMFWVIAAVFGPLYQSLANMDM
jgi:type IV pilus assembly protein PilC